MRRLRPFKWELFLVLLLVCWSLMLVWMTASAVDTNKGKKVYEAKCLTCHGKEGRGDGPTAQGLGKKPRNFTEPDFLKTRTDADLKKTILEGRPPMPAFKGTLKDKDIDEVIPFVKSLAVNGHASMKGAGQGGGQNK